MIGDFRAQDRRRDPGLTLVELLVVVSLLALVASVLAAAFVTVLRVTPETEFRVDDARATRALQTWLARDVASTPPHSGGVGVDGVTFSGQSTAGLELCGATGTNVLNLRWSDSDTNIWYVANYSIESDVVVRRICDSTGLADLQRLTADVSSAPCAAESGLSTPGPNVDGDSTDIDSVELCLVAMKSDGPLAGEPNSAEIVLSVSSRNGG